MIPLNIYAQLEMIAFDHPELWDAFAQDKRINADFFTKFTQGWEFLWVLKHDGVFNSVLPKLNYCEDVQQEINHLQAMLDIYTKFDYWYKRFWYNLALQPICVHVITTDIQGYGLTKIVTPQEAQELIDPYVHIHEGIWRIGYSDGLHGLNHSELCSKFPCVLSEAWREGYNFAQNNKIKDVGIAWLVYINHSTNLLN